MGQLSLTVWAWIESFRDMKGRGIWLPFLVAALLQGLLLLAMTQFYQPVVSWFMVPVIRALAGPMALHYPQFYLVLPGLFSEGNLLLDWIAGTFLYGLGYLLLWRAVTATPGAAPVRHTARSYGSLLLIRLPALLVYILLYLVLPRALAAGEGELHGMALRLMRLATFLGAVVTEGLLVYAPLAVLAMGRRAGSALKESVRTALRYPIATLLIVLVPNLVQLPLGAIMRRTERIIRELMPETVAWVVLGSIFLYVLVNFFVIAAAVRIYGARARRLEGDLG